VLASSPFPFGGYAEFISVPEDARNFRKDLVVHKPAAVSFADSATVALSANPSRSSQLGSSCAANAKNPAVSPCWRMSDR
jgi:hypothetical protein